jgi:hypothetical protein
VSKVDTVAESGTTLTVSIPDLIGFRVSRYLVVAKGSGRVTLKFESSSVTSDGKTVLEDKAPVLPFDLPPGNRFVRMIFTVRSSAADHNMAIVGAKDAGELNSFTERLRTDPEVCKGSKVVFCTWVPMGVGVRVGDTPGFTRIK